MRHIFWFQHKWKAVDIRHGKGSVEILIGGFNLETKTENVPATEILYRCDCGKVKTGTITGHWSLSHFVKEREK